MALTATAQRMFSTLPIYYSGEPLLERIIQAWANEIDRIDARLDAIKNGLVPVLATDDLGLLALWEIQVGLPPNPPDATVSQRVAKIAAVLQALDAGSAAGYIATISAAIDSGAWVLLRDTPGSFQDTLQIPFDPGSYNATQVEAIARRMHPAHRQLFMRYTAGFLLDESRLDEDTL